MNLKDSLELILYEYPNALQENFAGHDLAAILRKEVPSIVEQHVNEPERYKVRASAGQGVWAKSPWIAVFDVLVTDAPSYGYYPVYLFREDFTGVYLSLNQGVTSVQEKYKSSAKGALQAKAADFRAQIGGIPSRFKESEIDLRASSKTNYSSYYEAGNICARFYSADDIPTDSELVSDLAQLISIYDVLSYNETIPNGLGESEDDEHSVFIEDLRKFRQHKRIERNIRLSKEAKRVHGTTCQICEIKLEDIYGSLGANYIEAHHLTPLAELHGQRVALDPRKDFAVLCANCHRMIHRSDFPHDINRFKREHYLADLRGSAHPQN